MKKILAFTFVFLIISCIDIYSESNEFPFKVKISGNGIYSIILIPGLACSGDVWNETLPSLEKNFKCYTLTMAGFAGEPAMKEMPSYQFWVASIADYIRKNKIDKPILLGHSMGGDLAMSIAAENPDLISKIIVVDALPSLSALNFPAFVSKENPDCKPMLDRFKDVNDDQFYKMQKTTLSRMIQDTSHLEQAVGWSVKSDKTTFAKLFCDLMNLDLREKVAKIKCPSLIILEASFINMEAQINKQYEKFIKAKLVYATKGLHFVMYDDYDWYIKQVTEFVKN